MGFPHQIGGQAEWKIILERGITPMKLQILAQPTAEFLLALSALVDRNGDEVLDSEEASSFSFGGVQKASLELGSEWVAQGDQNGDGILTMKEVADNHF